MSEIDLPPRTIADQTGAPVRRRSVARARATSLAERLDLALRGRYARLRP